MSKDATFAEKYFEVFDKDTGEVRVCGRDACKTLMRACAELSPDGIYGNLESGYMNIVAIKDVAKKQGVI